jgi:copper resistance protein C
MPPSRRAARAVAVTLLAGLALLLGAAPALAHTRLLSTDPADGSSRDSAPEHVALTFNEPMSPEFSTITVIGPDGTNYQDGAVTAEESTISSRLLPLGPAGRYEIGYRVVSADGHPVTGSVAFTLTTAGPGATTAPPAEPATAAPPAPAPAAAPADESGGAPIWPWIVGAVVLVGGGVFAALRLGRG